MLVRVPEVPMFPWEFYSVVILTKYILQSILVGESHMVLEF